jgi:hypothetical protein
MSNGLLGKSLSIAGEFVKVYQVPVGVDFATVTAAIINTGSSIAIVDTAISSSTIPGQIDHIGWNDEITADGGSLEYTCYLMSPGESLFVRADSSQVIIRAYGLEKESI